MHGSEAVTFSATDEGPGIAYVKLLDNRKTIESQDADSNGGRCIPIPGHDAYTWAYQVPCKTTLGEHTYQFNTTQLSEGIQHVQVIVEDAAGNQAIAVDRSVDVDNASTGSLGAEPGPGSNQSPSSSTSASSNEPQSLTSGIPSTSALLPVNSEPASTKAVIRLGVHHRITRSFARRALRKLSGRLMDGHGHPIAHATLFVFERIGNHGTLQKIGHTTTGAKGAFTAKVPPGPSRLIELAYHVTAKESGYAATAKVHESVQAGVQLHITPQSTSPTGTILLSGRVLGPIPKHGVIVDLLVHYHGKWEPFRTPHTDSAGHFSVAYQFQGALGRFPFRARVPGGQAKFPFTRGASKISDVATR